MISSFSWSSAHSSHLPAPFDSSIQYLFDVIKSAKSFSRLSKYIIVLTQITKMLSGRSKAVIAVNSVFPFIAAFTVALRLYARTRRTLCLKSSDYTIVLALVMLLAHRNSPD